MNNDVEMNTNDPVRQRAEAIAAQMPEALADFSPEGGRQLFHELRVHQIELEMQNEELRRTQLELEAARTRYFDLYNLAPVGYIILNKQGTVLEANLTLVDLLGVTRQAVVQRPLTRFIFSPDQDIFYQHHRRLFASGTPQICELRLMRANGDPFWAQLEAAIKPENDDSKPTCRIIVSDITLRKQAALELNKSHQRLEKAVTQLQEMQAQLVQQERLAAVGQLAAGIAHDFNNILAVILLYAQMMNRTSQLLPWETVAVTTIEKQTQTAAHLVQQILDFSRRSMMEKQTLDWLSLLKEQVRLLHHTLPDNITVTMHTEAPGPYMVYADAARLQQIVLNLAVNARDAMPDGGELRLELNKLDLDAEQDGLPAGSWLRLRISDTGQGITPENSPHIFEPFFTTKPPGKGSGLGLSQAQGIVLQHDGRIELSTAVGQGTIFTIYLPTVAEEVELTIAPAVAQSGQRATVLLVEDSDSLREVLVTSLQVLNYEVTAVGNGREALDYLQANPERVDAILSDMIMPVMGGTELFQQVQRLARPIPMVIITGHQMDEELDELMTQGLRGWLMKPLDFNSLANLLEQALR